MRKSLIILSALLLAGIGASAQVLTPYEFHAEDWVTLDVIRVTQDNITYNDDNTITVKPTNGAGGTNNVALGNSLTYESNANAISTNGYYITSEQTCFVIVGSGLSTTDISDLWWLNGVNANVTAETAITFSDGQVLAYWDFSNNNDVMAKFIDGKMAIDGWTGAGLTSTGETATISYIGFCTKDEVSASFTIPENTYVHACTANRNVWTVSPETYDTWVWLDTNAAKEDGSGMAPPALSYYTTDGEKLPNATITHETIEGLTPGMYEVSMLIRIIDYDTNDDNEYFTLGPGTTFNANGISQDIYLGVNAHDGSYTETDNASHEDLYGTYTLYVEVGNEGTLDVSLNIEDATYNWIMFKNLTVKLLDESKVPTVEWTLGADYGTLMLPFDYTLTEESELTAYTISEVSDTAVTLSEETTSIKAGVPYIIGGTASDEAISFSGMPTAYNVSYTDGYLTGVQKATTAPAGSYVLQLQDEDEGEAAFYLVAEDSDAITVGAYHCYLNYESTEGVKLVVNFPSSDDVATRIDAVETAEAESGAIYDISGRRVAKAQKGIYIVNGKKMVIK